MKKTIVKLTATILSLCAISLSAFAQNSVSGKVVDQNGQPIVGASIMVEGTTNVGTVSDLDGAYKLSVPANSSLTASCIGYTSQTLPVNGTVVNFTLSEDSEFLEETVVIGYGVQKKSDLTGSVASVRSTDLTDRSTTDAAAALQGKAAGIQVINSSGAPGSGAEIRVRGYSSNGDAGLGPLLIVDGLKVDNIQYLDPSMIESMEVLKDAASAAIYGAQAGNGVVLITTKNGGKSKDGNVFYQYQMTRNSLGTHPQVMNAEQYITWQEEAGNVTRQGLLDSKIWDGKTDTDWASVAYAPSYSHRHTFGVQGGNDRGSYYTAITYTDQDGILRGKKDYYKRLSAQINADYKIKKWLQVGTNLSLERYNRQAVSEHSEYFQGSSIVGTLVIDPLTPVYYTNEADIPVGMQQAIAGGKQKVYRNEDGYVYATSKLQEGDGVNPLIMRDRQQGKNEGFNVRGTVFANFTPLKGLTVTSRFGFRIGQAYSSNYEDPYYVNQKVNSTTYNITAASTQNYYYQWENFANYNTTIAKKHNLGVMAGMSYVFSDNRGVNGGLQGTDPLKGYDDNFHYLTQDNGTGTKTLGGGEPNQSVNISYYGRLTYSYDNRYSVQANFRADAFDSSKLSAKNRWGFFPSVSAGWTISNEPFMKNVSKNALSFLKVRASWGINGNISVLNGYPYSADISYNSMIYQWHVDNNVISTGSIPSGLANPDLTWETSHQVDVGLDARFLNNRLTFAADWYNKNTEDLLVNKSNVFEVGINNSTVNAGSINNHGLEFELGWQDQIGDFHYSINGNFSTLSNKVTYLEPTVGHLDGAYFSNIKMTNYFEVGYPIWYFRGFEYAGVNKETGVPQYYDKDGKITEIVGNDDFKYVGSGIPTYTYGITLRLDWKGIDFLLFGTGAGGNQLMPCVYRTEHPRINSMTYFYENRWTPQNKNASMPSVASMSTDTNFWSSSANLFKGDYFRIKQIQLGYTLPKAWSQKAFIDSLRIYASLDDFFTITKYPGFDPETASTGAHNGIGMDKGSYPNSRKIIFGVNLSF
ncbi:MAG: TonB-dependent receptor [Bacteroidales bacterium]|nr:TonB-dependent receptor [Bacteroidales bacterium]